MPSARRACRYQQLSFLSEEGHRLRDLSDSGGAQNGSGIMALLSVHPNR